MEIIIKYYDSINTKVINIQKELNQLKYLLELKKSKSITQEEDDEKQFETKQKMYLSKLHKKRNFKPEREYIKLL